LKRVPLVGKIFGNDPEPGFKDKLLDDGGIVMTIRVIYKDKNVGRVNESSLEELIKTDRIAAFAARMTSRS
jgi:hypothetical protein